ncbi:MAG: type II toxin-antitoxin system death-on-curing family toxin [Nitratireductor sp.]|nr:type II toxin-antitoxin system death-on-curing family toxin [Nitratireductor sp.]
MRYLTIHEVLHIHEALINAYGGMQGVRDQGLVEAALLRPQTGYYADLIEEAAALWESLAMNHGFIDGNKRIAFAAMEIFLDLNGISITASQDDAEAFIYHHLEARTFTKDNLDAWLRDNTKPV